jgi:hypothetical protein
MRQPVDVRRAQVVVPPTSQENKHNSMSIQQLIADFGECRHRLAELRSYSDYLPLRCAMLRKEGDGGTIPHDLPFARVLGNRPFLPCLIASQDHNPFAVAFYIDTPATNEGEGISFVSPEEASKRVYQAAYRAGENPARLNAALKSVEALTKEAQRLLSGLPRWVQEHLVLPPGDCWWRTVFHLAWHFPRLCLRAKRERLLTNEGGSFGRAEETVIQMHGTAGRSDLLPGLIYSELEHDIRISSESAMDVIVEVLRSCPEISAQDGLAERARAADRPELFRQLRSEFEQGRVLPGGLESELLKLADSFETPPATEWASLLVDGCVERFLLLSRLDDLQEWCQIGGPATKWFCELAERAGNALPPNTPLCPILFDSIDRYDEMGLRIRISGPRPVMNRGPAERWVGFVFAVLKQHVPEALQIHWGTDMGPLSYGLATLDRDLFAASVLAIDLTALAGESTPVAADVPTTILDNEGASPGTKFNEWKFLRDAPAEQAAVLPAPIEGRFVIALWPPALDGFAEQQGEAQYLPRSEHLALMWKNDRGEEVLHGLDGSGCLLRGGRHDATWLPDGWEMDLFPTGWTLPHLECWFACALELARMENRGDIPPASVRCPSYAPTPRGLVTHAYLIVRHLELPTPPTEPRGPIDQAGCLAELRDILGFLRRSLQPTEPQTGLPQRAKQSRRMTVEEANETAMKLAKQMKQGFFLLSEREQAKKIRCSWQTWKKTPFYLKSKKHKARLASKAGSPDAPGSPPVVSLTSNLEAVTGEGSPNEVLEQLIAEQEADSEPSPLADDLPDAPPKKVRVRKRL